MIEPDNSKHERERSSASASIRVEANREFAEKFSFNFPLLCDIDKKIGVAYGAADDASARTAGRIAYLIGADGKIERATARSRRATIPRAGARRRSRSRMTWPITIRRRAARRRGASGRTCARTPLRHYAPLDAAVGGGVRVLVKHENLNPTNAFKVRNACR